MPDSQSYNIYKLTSKMLRQLNIWTDKQLCQHCLTCFSCHFGNNLAKYIIYPEPNLSKF